ncbi:MAG TPA: permease prefix domain 1-containing protein [Microbacteriaceae bacterium]
MSTADNTNIHRYLDEVFGTVTMTPELQDLKEELRSNLTARVNELIAGGVDANTAATRAIDELGDIRELVSELDGTDRPQAGEPVIGIKRSAAVARSATTINDAYRVYRVRPKPAFVIRTVILAGIAAASAVLIALSSLHVIAWSSTVLALIAVIALALPGGIITADSLRQETSTHYASPVPSPRSTARAPRSC